MRGKAYSMSRPNNVARGANIGVKRTCAPIDAVPSSAAPLANVVKLTRVQNDACCTHSSLVNSVNVLYSTTINWVPIIP